MAERILAAMNLLDAHTKVIPQKLKQRALGDIDGKYSVVDPLLEISYYPTIKNDVPLSGVRKTNPSNDRSPEDIVEDDRERMVQSADRARSAPSPFKDTPMASSTRPMTSSSWVTGGSLGTRDDDRHIQHSFLTSATSRASIKRLAFTSPAVKVGPADVRDEIMDEIVNKPLVFHRNNIKSQSAPPSGRMTSSVLKSAGTRSTRWVVSPKRAKTSFHRRRRGARSWEKNPGPFMTVKVTGKDLWVVSNSTPTSYFTNKKDDGLRETSGMNGTKVAKWEDTAEAVPKAEQVSPPRHERLLGAPAQFAPAIQWLRYDPSSPPRKPPVLAPFREGRYYNVETTRSRNVSQHLNASPGVRIARNGEVLSHSMKLESLEESDQESEKETESEGSDIDVASLIPAKLAAKIKKHYGTPENKTSDEEEGEEDDVGEEHEEEIDVRLQSAEGKDENGEMEIGENGIEALQKLDKDDHDIDSGHDSEEASELSSMSGDDPKEVVEKSHGQEHKLKGPLLTKESLALLTKLTGHDPPNPIVDCSAGSATSFEESLESYELNDFLVQNGINVDSPRMTNGHTEQEDVWRILENATPNFWITKSKQQKLAILKRLRRQRKSEQIASTRESLKSAKTKEEVNEVILPLCWEDEVNKANTRIVQVRSGVSTPTQHASNTSLPVVFHKILRYDKLPTATIASPSKPSVPTNKSRPRSATSQTGVEGVIFGFGPNRGYRAPVSTPRSNRSVRTKSASVGSSVSNSSVRGHSAPHSLVNGTEIIRRSIDLADLLRVTPDSFPAKTHQMTTRAHTVKKERVTIVHDDISETEMESVRKIASNSMKTDGEAGDPDKHKLGATLANRIGPNFTEKKDRIPAPVGTLNLAGIDTDTTTNETVTFSSQRLSELKSASFTTPQNTPKTPMIHHSVALTPRASARGQHSEAMRLGLEAEEEITKGVDAHSDGAPLSSKPISAAQQENLGFGTRATLSARTKNGFSSVPISQSRLKSGSSRGTPAHHGLTGPRPMKALPNMQSTVTNGGIDLPMSVSATQIMPEGPPTKTADFIQITQSLHISDRLGAQGDAPAITGNKMYDSYMRELAAQGGPAEIDERNDTKGGIIGRGLGGTSGKSSGFSLPRTVKKSLSSYRQNPNMSPFTAQAGRRSGLTMVPQDSSQKVGPFGLGVKGDQVRLNIDKNIHNIYRDLGLLKSNSAPSKVDQHTVSPGRSHLSSARSRATQREDSVISIPTASEPSVAANVPLQPSAETLPQESPTPDEAKAKRPSSSNPSIIVQDSGTQWSGRTVKFEVTGSHPTQSSANGHSNGVTSPAEAKSEPDARDENRLAIIVDDTAPEGPTQDIATDRTNITERDNVQESNSPTSERSLARAISRASDAVSATESNASLGSQPPLVQRSASETLLDRLAEMGDREESSDATEEEVEEAEDVEVKGVTRVTVNIPAKPEAIS